MTIQSESIKAGPFTGDDATTVFPFSFKVFAGSDVRVIFTSTSGVESDLVLDTDYSISVNADQETSPGGSVTYPISGSPLATGEKLTLLNNVAFLQGTDLQNGGAWNPQTVEDRLDQLTMLALRNKEAAGRGVAVPPSDDVASLTLPTKTARANTYLAFDENGEPFAAATPSGAPTTAFMATMLDDADAAEARDTLELGTASRSDELTRIGALAVDGTLSLILYAATISFRAPTYGASNIYQRAMTANASLIVSNGSTLGTVSGEQSRLVLLAVDSASSTVELAVANAAGNHNFDETTLITTVAEGGAGGADSADVIYSTAVHTNRPFRVVGYIEVDSVGGLWLSTVAKIQPMGGNAYTAIDTKRAIQAIDASVAANALTLTLKPTTIDFRSSTITSGAVNRRTVPSAISVTVSSGSTLGTVNAVAARLAVLAIDNAGTVELAVVNLAGGNNLDETTLISTTAEGGAGGADSANVIYSTTARSNVAFRVVGFIDITEATAGTWATAPTRVQGAGGNSYKAINPNPLLAEYEVTGSAVTSIDFQGLDINTHKNYTLILTGGLDANLNLYVNGDTTDANYHNVRVYSNGAAPAADETSAPRILVSGGAGLPQFAVIRVALAGGYVGATVDHARDINTTANGSIAETMMHSIVTHSNITQLTLTCTTASGINVGFKVELYRGDV